MHRLWCQVWRGCGCSRGLPLADSALFGDTWLQPDCPQATVANWTCPACKIPGVNVTYVAEYTPLNLQAYVSMNQKTNAIVVAFRG